jgi:hypothetical protein
MENQDKKDDFIRKLVRAKGPEKAPDHFTEKVMRRISNNPAIDDTPLLTTGTWIAIILGVAAMIVVIFTVDFSFFDQIFSTRDIQEVSIGIFSKGFIHSFTSFISSLHLSSTTLVIIAAAAGLVVIERLLNKRFGSANLLFI